jgi:hypothetical protein
MTPPGSSLRFGNKTHTVLWLALFLLATDSVATGQATPKPTSRKQIRTEVRVELITDRRGAPLAAQRWAKLFQNFKVPLRIRRSVGGERTSVREKTSSRLRQVTVIGLLDRSGRILVPGKSFSPGNPNALGKWLEELKAFGAKGNPTGQPAFGLSEGQFNTLFEILAQPFQKDLKGQTLGEAIRSLGLPAHLKLDLARLGSDSRYRLPARTNGPGLSRGTTLAALLATRGLAFQPRRTPAGDMELRILKTPALKRGAKTPPKGRAWPLGWPPRLSRIKTARPLFEIVPVELNDAAFLDVIDAIVTKTEIPMLIDHHRLAQQNIDPNTLTVTIKPKKTSWFQLQKSATNPHHLTRDLRIDEAGKPFVLITPIRSRPVSKK